MDVVTDLHISDLLHEPVRLAVSPLNNIRGRIEILGDVVDDISTGAVKFVGEVIETMMATSEDIGIVEVKPVKTALIRGSKGAMIRGGAREEIGTQEVMHDMISLERRK